MAEEMKPLQPKDKVFIKSLGLSGVVLGLRLPDDQEPEHERIYRVQITRFCRRSDLELDDIETKQQKRKIARDEMAARLDTAQDRLLKEIAAGHGVKDTTLTEFIEASNEHRKSLGDNPMFEQIDKDRR